MNNNFNIGKRIYDLRTSLGLSQEQLALLSDITPNYLRQIEHCKKNPTINVIEKICFSLNISLSDFFATEVPQTFSDSIETLISIEVKNCSPAEKEFILHMCQSVKKLRHSE